MLSNSTLSEVTSLTGLGSGTSSCCPIVTLCLAYGVVTKLTSLRSGTSSLGIVVRECSAFLKATNITMLSSLASSLYPYVSIGSSLALSFLTYGAGLGSRASSLGPSMAKSLALGLTALTSLGRLAGSVCPYVLVCVLAENAKNRVLNVIDSADNGLGKHITRSEREQKDH